MTRSSRLPRNGITAVALAFPVALVVAALNDTAMADAAAHAPRVLIEAGIFISRFGLSGYMLVIAAAIVLGLSIARRRGATRLFGLSVTSIQECAAYFFVVIAGSGITCQILKHGIGRARPKFLHQYGAFHFEGPTWRAAIDSFPSGHSTTVFAAAVVFSLLYPPWRIVFFAIALIIGLARILAGAHFPSDVVAGAALGSVMALWLAHVFAARNIAFAEDVSGIALKRDPIFHGTPS